MILHPCLPPNQNTFVNLNPPYVVCTQAYTMAKNRVGNCLREQCSFILTGIAPSHHAEFR